MENLPVNEKQFLFARALTEILQDKKLTGDQNQKILQKILLKSTPLGLTLEVMNATFCHSSCQRSAML